MKKIIAALSLMLPISIVESAVTEVVVNVDNTITFTHVGSPVQWGRDIVSSILFSSLQVAFENDATRTHPSFAFDSSSGKAYFQSTDFSWDDSVYSPFYWFWPAQDFVNGAQPGTNYMVLDVDDNGHFETIVEIFIPQDATPPGVGSGNTDISIIRYVYDLDANTGETILGSQDTLSPAVEPAIELKMRSDGNLTIEFTGILQKSDLLGGWTDLDPQPLSPYVIQKEEFEQKMFFRARE